MRTPTTALLALMVTVAGGALTAQADPIPITAVTTAQLLADFNAIVDGQFNSTSDTEGPVLIGGDLGPGTAALNQNGVVLGTTAGTTAITGYGEVNVFGSQTAFTNNSDGTVLVGGTISSANNPFGLGATSVTSSYIFPPGATTSDNAATFQNNVWSKMLGLSTSLAALSANSNLTIDTTHFLATFAPGSLAGPTTPAIFNVSLAQLNALTSSYMLGFSLKNSSGGEIELAGAT